MGVRISRLEIDSCGPIARFHESLKPLTVVYGANEKGKTTIVENVIAALFRERKEGLVPAVRATMLGSARVHVTGLGRRTEVFSPLDKRRRLDELLQKRDSRLPARLSPDLSANLFGLLVVRAGETEIAAGRGGLDKSLAKRLLSREQTYERIAAGLPGEVAYTELSDGRVAAQRRIGAFKAHEEALQRLQGLEALAEELSASLSETGLLELRARRGRLEEQREAQARARRHEACAVSRRILACEVQLARLDEPLLRQLAAKVQEHERLGQELAAAEKDGERLTALQAESRWLEEAQKRWGQSSPRLRAVLQRLALGLCALFLLGAIASSLLLPGLLPLALGLSLAALLLVALSGLAGRPGSQADGEQEALRREFQQRFGRAPTTLADFAAARSELDRRLGGVEQAQTSRRRVEERLAALQGEIRGSLLRFPEAEPGTVADSAGWAALVRRLSETRSRHELEAQRLRERLASLGVDESDYLEDDPGTAYSREAERALAAEIEDVEATLRERERQAAGLHQRLAAHLGPAFVGQTRVEELAAALEARREEEERIAREALASIIAGHVVKDVLAEFRRAEDEELERSLNDPRLSELLARLTGRYDRLHLEGERLLVGNGEQLYDLREMSTGAREQVLLALRLGLAAALSGRETLFLLLDDAFQHSDWQRRGALVEQAAATVRAGWQVIYFTMDDDIRRRFVETAKQLPADQFRLIEL